MNFFEGWFGKKRKETIQSELGVFEIYNYSSNDFDITEDRALSIPTVINCRELVCASVAQLPMYLYQKQPDGSIKQIEDNRVRLINESPNSLMNGYNFKKSITSDYLFYGASYVKPERKLNTITALYPLPTKDVTVQKYRQGYKTDARIILTNSGEEVQFTPEELVSVLKDSYDGVTSKGILDLNANTISLALEELEYSRNIVRNGAVPSGILTTEGKLSDKSLNNLKGSWEKLYSGSENAGKTPVLEGGLKYQQISMKPNDLDLVNSKKGTVAEICKLFNVPESMVNANANKYASNEANGIQFLQYCMAPIIIAIEAAFNNSLLLESEKEDDYFFKFDVSELLRTTEKEKIETVAKGLENKLFSINEARTRLGMPNIDNDYFLYKLGDVFYNAEDNRVTIANTGTTLDLNNPMTQLQMIEEKAKIELKYAPKPPESEEPKEGEATPKDAKKVVKTKESPPKETKKKEAKTSDDGKKKPKSGTKK